jgi:hypothetical protein
MTTMGRRRAELRSVNPFLSQPICGPGLILLNVTLAQ